MITRAMKPKIRIAIYTAVALVALSIALTGLVITTLYKTSLSYIYCSTRESSWQRATNEKELEARLFAFYEKSSIVPADSSMGLGHVMLPGQRMTRYMIFDKKPLDIVYNSDGTIAEFYVSYE